MPLTDEEYAPGRTVRTPADDDFVIADHIIGVTGNRYLLLADEDGDLYPVPSSIVRDQWSARTPEEVEQDRQDRDAAVTDDPDVTDSDDPATDPAKKD